MDEAAKIQSVQSIIHGLAAQFSRNCPYLDREELADDCQAVALQAVRTHNAKVSSLTSWVHTCVWRYLAMSFRSGAWRRRVSCQELPRLPVELQEEAAAPEHFSLGSLLYQVSGEAKMAVHLVVDRDLRRVSLTKTLQKEFGWEMDLVGRVFQELKEAMS